MGERTCLVSGCTAKFHGNNRCATHNWRFKKYGSDDKPVRRVATEADRFWAKVNADGVCWEWSASTAGGGYGWFLTPEGSVPAHRWTWEHLVGPIPEGLQLDHLCRNPPCVN